MTYPLGSFPRFGHQARWASERRNRAIMNSIFTRQMMAEEHLAREMALYEVFCKLLQGITASNEEEQRKLAETGSKLVIRRRHEERRSVYGGGPGKILLFSAAQWACPELKTKVGMSICKH